MQFWQLKNLLMICFNELKPKFCNSCEVENTNINCTKLIARIQESFPLLNFFLLSF